MTDMRPEKLSAELGVSATAHADAEEGRGRPANRRWRTTRATGGARPCGGGKLGARQGEFGARRREQDLGRQALRGRGQSARRGRAQHLDLVTGVTSLV